MCTNACMYAHMVERVNRVGVPSSVRDSQQQFLVLDGAVRMHWLVLSLLGERACTLPSENGKMRPGRCLHL